MHGQHHMENRCGWAEKDVIKKNKKGASHAWAWLTWQATTIIVIGVIMAHIVSELFSI